jgi:hypothetical protein
MHSLELLEQVQSLTKQVTNDNQSTRSTENELNQSSFIDENEMVILYFPFFSFIFIQ